MHRTRVGAVFLSALLSIVGREAAAADRFQIALNLVHDGTPFAKADLRVIPGVETTVSIPEENLTVALVVTDSGNGLVTIVARVASAYGEMRPTLTTRFGREASISNGEIAMNVTASKNRVFRQGEGPQ